MPVSALPAMRAAIAYSAPATAAASGWWLADGTIDAANAIAVYQPKGAASLAASYINLANPGTYDLTFGSAPTFDTSYGWLGTAAAYADAGFYFQDGWSLLIRFSDAPQDGSYKASCGASEIKFQTSRNLGGDGGTMDTRVTYGAGFDVVNDTAMTAGVALVCPGETFVDGVSLVTYSRTITATDNFFILAHNNGSGTAVNHFNGGKVQAIVIYNTDVAAAQSDLYTAAAAL